MGKGTGVCNGHARGLHPRRPRAHGLATCDLPYPTTCGLLDLLTCLHLANPARSYSYPHSTVNFRSLSYRHWRALHLKSATSPHHRPPRFLGPTPAPVPGLLPGCAVPRRTAGSLRSLPAAASLPASGDYNQTMFADSLTSHNNQYLPQKNKETNVTKQQT